MAQTYTLIDSALLTTNQATITFTNIPTSYISLVMQVSARSARAVPADPVKSFINNDTTQANYETGVGYTNQNEYGFFGSNATAEAPLYASGSVPGSSIFGISEGVYINSNSASTNRAQIGAFAMFDTSTSSNGWYYITGGSRSTTNSNVITRLDLQVFDTNQPFIAGTRLDLYGLS